MTDKLAGLAQHNVVVAASGDIASIRAAKAQDCTNNPSLILRAASRPEYASLLSAAVAWAATRERDADRRLSLTLDRLAVNSSVELSRIAPGYVSTEVDTRLAFNAPATVARAERIIGLYREAGVEASRSHQGRRRVGRRASSRRTPPQGHQLRSHADLQPRTGGDLRRGRTVPELALRNGARGTTLAWPRNTKRQVVSA